MGDNWRDAMKHAEQRVADDRASLCQECKTLAVAAERERVRAVLCDSATLSQIARELASANIRRCKCQVPEGDPCARCDTRLVIGAIAARLGIDLAQPAGEGDDNG